LTAGPALCRDRLRGETREGEVKKMVKKLVLGILLLTVVTTTLFAWMEQFQYAGNVTEQQFAESAAAYIPPKGVYRTGKLPNGVVREINYALQDYSLDVGDMFLAAVIYNNGLGYAVWLRITDAKSCRWQFYAWMNSY
jgi:hypothetical protein